MAAAESMRTTTTAVGTAILQGCNRDFVHCLRGTISAMRRSLELWEEASLGIEPIDEAKVDCKMLVCIKLHQEKCLLQ